MIVSCMDISEKDLIYGIDYYRKEHDGHYPHYLIMNYESKILLARKRGLDFERTYTADYDEVYKFRGITVAICNELKTGEVDVV